MRNNPVSSYNAALQCGAKMQSGRDARLSRIAEARTVKTFIVEDSPLILEKLVATLEELAPVQVFGWAADEAAAVEWLAQSGQACDLVIIDIFLRAGSGLGVLRSARQMGLPGKRVVLTNYATQDMRNACLELGADRVFDKSSDVEELIAYCGRLHDGVDTGAGNLH